MKFVLLFSMLQVMIGSVWVTHGYATDAGKKLLCKGFGAVFLADPANGKMWYRLEEMPTSEFEELHVLRFVDLGGLNEYEVEVDYPLTPRFQMVFQFHSRILRWGRWQAFADVWYMSLGKELMKKGRISCRGGVREGR